MIQHSKGQRQVLGEFFEDFIHTADPSSMRTRIASTTNIQNYKSQRLLQAHPRMTLLW